MCPRVMVGIHYFSCISLETYSHSPHFSNMPHGLLLMSTAFDGKADLKVICSEEVMGKMIRKEVQPQQGNMRICNTFLAACRDVFILYVSLICMVSVATQPMG